MGLFGRHNRAKEQEAMPSAPLPHAELGTVWLPGSLEVAVAGETYHSEAILAAQLSGPPGHMLTAVLVPQPANEHDSHAVAVYVQNQHVGFLPRAVAQQVQAALLAFARAHAGALVSCPAEIRMHDIGPQVILLLDPSPLSVAPSAFVTVPDLDVTLAGLLSRLDESAPALSGTDAQARAALAAAEQARAETDADYERSPQDWPRVEAVFRSVAGRLARAGDPLISAAWLGVARATRYQRGRRDDTLTALVEALFWDRLAVDAWADLVELASSAPHIPTLVALVARMPFEARPGVLPQLLAISYGRDRLGRMTPATGQLLRDELLKLAETQGDMASIAFLAGHDGLMAEKAGNLITAVACWRAAVLAGTTDQTVADRFSIWLSKQHEYAEAAHVLRQALAASPRSTATRERLQHRLTRCEHALAKQGGQPSESHQP